MLRPSQSREPPIVLSTRQSFVSPEREHVMHVGDDALALPRPTLATIPRFLARLTACLAGFWLTTSTTGCLMTDTVSIYAVPYCGVGDSSVFSGDGHCYTRYRFWRSPSASSALGFLFLELYTP